MLIPLKGSTFCVLGRFSSYRSAQAVGDALALGGGGFSRRLLLKTTAMIYGGDESTNMTNRAAARGLPVLNEADLLNLLEHGQVEVDHEPPREAGGSDSLDVLLGEVRGVLANAPSREVWAGLVEILNRCSPEQMEPLVDYIQAHIARWTPRAQLYCELPKSWFPAMSEGISSPALRLVRWIDMERTAWLTTSLKRFFGCADLTHVHRIDFPRKKEMTRGAFAHIAKDPKFKTVRALSFERIGPGIGAGLDAGDALSHVRAVGLRGRYHYGRDREALHELMTASSMSNVRTLMCHGQSDDAALFPKFSSMQGCLPNVTHWVFDLLGDQRHMLEEASKPIEQLYIAQVCYFAGEGGVEHIHTLTISTPILGEGEPMNDLRGFYALQTLNLYVPLEHLALPNVAELVEAVLALPKLFVPDSLERFMTNIPLDTPSLMEFAQNNSKLDVIYDPGEMPYDGAFTVYGDDGV